MDDNTVYVIRLHIGADEVEETMTDAHEAIAVQPAVGENANEEQSTLDDQAKDTIGGLSENTSTIMLPLWPS